MMKHGKSKHLIALLLLLFLVACIMRTANQQKHSLIGTWISEDSPSRTVTFSSQLIVSKWPNSEKSYSYRLIERDANFVHLTIQDEGGTVPCLAEFVDNDIVYWSEGFPGDDKLRTDKRLPSAKRINRMTL